MSDMADVLAAHGEWRYTNGAGSDIVCRKCGAPVENVTAHQAAALSAAGFGPVKEAVVGAVSGALEDAADRVMGPSDVLLDGATCRWIAMELRESAQALRATS